MNYNSFKGTVLDHLVHYKINILGIRESGIWAGNGEKKSHILPKELKNLNLLDTVKIPHGIKEHKYSHHLNSSQIMCINFFEPLCNDDEGKTLLLNIVSKALGREFASDSKIEGNPLFEYMPDTKEGTNFDFFFRLTTGEKIYFEIKYTENGFGSTGSVKDNPDKYAIKCKEIYSEHCAQSLYLKDISEKEFYKNYQIWRNISYIKNEKDFVVFLFPFESENLVKEIHQTIGKHGESTYANVFAADWCKFCELAVEFAKNSEYFLHFKAFKDKYFGYDFREIQ